MSTAMLDTARHLMSLHIDLHPRTAFAGPTDMENSNRGHRNDSIRIIMLHPLGNMSDSGLAGSTMQLSNPRTRAGQLKDT